MGILDTVSRSLFEFIARRVTYLLGSVTPITEISGSIIEKISLRGRVIKGYINNLLRGNIGDDDNNVS